MRIPNGVAAVVQPQENVANDQCMHPAYGPVHILDFPVAIAEALDELEEFLDKEWTGTDGHRYTSFERLRCSCNDGCTEKSIYVGVCGGNKKQPPLSTQVGQYETRMHKAFSEKSQLKLKRDLMVLFNQYVKIAEAQAYATLPDACKKQARLRQILQKHPVFRQNYAIDDWFAKGSNGAYVGTGWQFNS